MQIVSSIWGWSMVLVILGFIPYVIWSIRTAIKKNWNLSVATWKEAPFDSDLEKYLDFALYASSKHSEEIRGALSRKGTFYSFFYYDHGSSPGNVDFFVVDLVGGRIYEINVNT